MTLYQAITDHLNETIYFGGLVERKYVYAMMCIPCIVLLSYGIAIIKSKPEDFENVPENANRNCDIFY